MEIVFDSPSSRANPDPASSQSLPFSFNNLDHTQKVDTQSVQACLQ